MQGGGGVAKGGTEKVRSFVTFFTDGLPYGLLGRVGPFPVPLGLFWAMGAKTPLDLAHDIE